MNAGASVLGTDANLYAVLGTRRNSPSQDLAHERSEHKQPESHLKQKGVQRLHHLRFQDEMPLSGTELIVE